MVNEGQNKFESVYSSKVRAGKRRTYFFDVRKTKGEDYYITITESTKRFDGSGYERHKLFLYKEDFNRFINSLSEVIDHVKQNLMPDFDYELYERRQKEWEAQLEEEGREQKGDSKTFEEIETADDADLDNDSPEESEEEEIGW